MREEMAGVEMRRHGKTVSFVTSENRERQRRRGDGSQAA